MITTASLAVALARRYEDVSAVFREFYGDSVRVFKTEIPMCVMAAGSNQLVTDCTQLKRITSKSGKRYNTDAASTQQLLCLTQSTPSLKSKPFKVCSPNSEWASEQRTRPQTDR